MNDQILSITVDDSHNDRLDIYLTHYLKDYSRTRIQSLIRKGLVLIDGAIPEKTGIIVERGAIIEVHIPAVAPTSIVAENIELEVIFENDDLMVINKPAGLVVHPGPGHSSGTLVNAALAHAPDMEGIGGEKRPGIVHRLDKDTSGLILIAKNDRSQRWLVDQFKARKVTKIYWTLVDGHPPTPQGRIEAAIGRDPIHRQKMAIVSMDKGRDAITEYQQLARYHKHTYIEAHPVTGRTHQIRLHMAFLGCPVVGDRTYGHLHPTIAINRFFLHAARITVLLPGEKSQRTFEVPLPADLQAIMNSLE